jgi:hypothetical protein
VKSGLSAASYRAVCFSGRRKATMPVAEDPPPADELAVPVPLHALRATIAPRPRTTIRLVVLVIATSLRSVSSTWPKGGHGSRIST